MMILMNVIVDFVEYNNKQKQWQKNKNKKND